MQRRRKDIGNGADKEVTGIVAETPGGLQSFRPENFCRPTPTGGTAKSHRPWNSREIKHPACRGAVCLRPAKKLNDGTGADHYLWLTGQIGRRLRVELPITGALPVREQ